MTDREQIAKILENAGIVFTISEESGEVSYGYQKAHAYDSSLEVEQSDKHIYNLGYSGFVTVFYFDEVGKLVCMGAWE
jgi:hypothetical protein